MIADAFSKEYDDWIIAYCLDSDEFFVTRQRGFFWESDSIYKTKRDAIHSFENNLSYYVSVRNEILMKAIMYYKPETKVYLADTDVWYNVNYI